MDSVRRLKDAPGVYLATTGAAEHGEGGLLVVSYSVVVTATMFFTHPSDVDQISSRSFPAEECR